MKYEGDSVLESVRSGLATVGLDSGEVRVLAAVSGGVDSVVLLQGLCALDVKVGVAHLDHGTREGQSAEDAAWVESLAARLGVKFFGRRLDVPGLAAESGKSFEEVAREVRYDFLAEVALAEGFDAIATGHHANDQAETVLMRIVRGTSVTGLAGIPREGEWNGIRIVRPLLDVGRDAIESYAAEHGLEYREDGTNSDTAFFRNRIRHDLLPELRETYNAGIEDALLNLSALSRDEDALLLKLTEAASQRCIRDDESIDRRTFREVPMALQRRMLVYLSHRVGGVVTFEGIEKAVAFVDRGESGSRCDFGGGVTLSNGRDETVVVLGAISSKMIQAVKLSVPGKAAFCDSIFDCCVLEGVSKDELKRLCSPTKQIVDGDSLGAVLVVRTRRDGDRFRPFGMKGTRKVKDYFGDLGLPMEVRDRVPIVATEDEIVWIAGYAVSDLFAVTERTTRFVLIEVLNCEDE